MNLHRLGLSRDLSSCPTEIDEVFPDLGVSLHQKGGLFFWVTVGHEIIRDNIYGVESKQEVSLRFENEGVRSCSCCVSVPGELSNLQVSRY